jgi:hypothetical protein
MGLGGQHHASDRFTPGKTRYPLYKRLGGPQGRSGRVRKISPQRDSIPGPSSPLFTYLHLMMRLRMCGAVSSLPSGAFMRWEVTNFSFQPVNYHLGPEHVAVNNTNVLLAIFTILIISSTYDDVLSSFWCNLACSLWGMTLCRTVMFLLNIVWSVHYV